MKNIFYLPVIFILLVSCKGSSFLHQRYTHLGHAANKHEQKNTAVASHKNTEVKSVASFSVNNQQAEATVKPNTVTEPLPVTLSENKPVVKPPAKTKAAEVIAKADIFKLSAKKEIGTSTRKAEAGKNAVAKAAGIIGKVLKIIILVLILAIVLGFVLLATVLQGQKTH